MSDIKQQIQQASARNAELLLVLAQTDHAAPALQEQLRFIKDLEAQLATTNKQLNTLEAKRVSELADHVKYRDSHVRRFMFKATGRKEKFEARAAKEEEEYYDVLQQQHETTTVNNNLKFQLEEAQNTRTELQEADTLHSNTQRELDNLYNAIFAGATPHFPEEDELEKQSDSALQRYHDTRVRHEEEKNVVSLILKAVERVKYASIQMEEARSASRMDLFGGGLLADAMERSALSKADIAIREARTLTSRAHFDDLPRVGINQGHIMRDVFFDNIVTDMQFHEEIKRGQAEVATFARALQDRLAASKDRLNAVEGELKEREQSLEEARRLLQAERQKVFERVSQETQ
ncbi:hypothetical protein EDB81DRAFT_783758 [Dactylonectria macrodidyma]|uniref:Uncharacterized protein n=1 Tax=Dactylonectria macrodidyma TaxID=307937 RepID=A0A9P9JGV0_9HYPO|nr:hypothetical protein EDB81DRAFT_783758 [Dactylonectria macrodidyma]